MISGVNSGHRTLNRAKVLLVLADTVAVVVSLALSLGVVGRATGWDAVAWRHHAVLALATLPVWPMVFAQHRMYGARFVTRLFDEYRRLTHGLAVGLLCIILIGFVAGVEVSRAWAFAVLLSTGAIVGAERFVARKIFEARRARGSSVRSVLIVGTNVEALDLYYMLRDTSTLGYHVVGFVDDDGDAPPEIDGLPVFEGIASTPELVEDTGADGVIVAATAMDLSFSSRMIRQLTEAGVHVELTSTLRDIASHRLTVRPLGRFPVVYLEPVHRYGWRRVAKRSFDMAVAVVGLVVASPVIAVAAVAIKLTSPGPVLFRQQRVGRHGECFNLFKLRTMVVNAEDLLIDLRNLNEVDGPLFKIEHDPRITRVGHFLRRFSIDELPQLWNVVRGEMSLVGPRPALESERAEWPVELVDRLTVKPGITGMWQVNGRSGNTFAEYERLDLYYVDNWSILTDLAILLKTVPVVLSSRGAC